MQNYLACKELTKMGSIGLSVACLTADPRVVSSDPLIQEGLVLVKVCAHILVNCLED